MPFRDIAFAVLVALIWGANFVVAKIGLAHFPPLFLMALRFLLVAAVLLPFAPKPKYRWKDLLIVSCAYGVGYHALIFCGLAKGLDVASSIITVQLNVPFTSLLGAYFLKDRLGWKQLTGMAIAFFGIVIIVGSPAILSNMEAFSLVLLAAFCWAIFNVHIKTLGKIEIVNFLAWVSVLSVPQLLVLSYFMESNQWSLLVTMPISAGFSLIYMALLSTVLAFGLWFHLLRHHSVHQVAPFSMLMPVFGIISAMLYFNDTLTWTTVIGGVTTFVGVGIMVLRKRKTLYSTINATD